MDFLWDLVAESDHPFLGGTNSSCVRFRPFTFLFSWIGLLDTFKCLTKLEKTLWNRSHSKFILVLPVPWDHLKDVIEGLYHFHEFFGSLGVEKTRQLVQVAIKLLDPLHKLPDWDSVGLLQPVAHVKTLDLSHVTLENCE